MSRLAILRAEAAAAERDAKDAEYCDDNSATMPGGVLSRAWARHDRALADLALAEAMDRLLPRMPATLLSEIERNTMEDAS